MFLSALPEQVIAKIRSFLRGYEYLHQNRLYTGALLIIAAELMFALMGASIRQVSIDLNNGMVVFARNLVGLVLLSGLTFHAGRDGLRTRVPHLHLLRGIAGLGAMYCFFYAIAHMPLADAMLLKLSAPLFMPLVALFWLGERFTWHVVAALAVGFTGVAAILLPDFDTMAPVVMIALLGGALAAVAKVTVRRLSATEPASRTVFYFSAIGTAVSMLPLFWLWVTPSPTQLAWLLVVGGFATALKFKPFLKLCAATFLVFNGFILIASFQSYVIIYYVFGGDAAAGSEFVGHSGLLQGIMALVAVALVTWLATKIGKRQAFFVSTGISIIGYAAKWFCYTPDNPWLVLIPAPLMAFGLAGLFTLMPSMVADVVDMDELETHERREGMYGSIFWWVVKLGQSIAIFGGGVLLVATGFDVDLGGNQAPQTITLMRVFDAFVPCAASAIAIWAIYTFSITEEKAHDIRKELEARRGATAAA